jgi:hypothetical protein
MALKAADQKSESFAKDVLSEQEAILGPSPAYYLLTTQRARERRLGSMSGSADPDHTVTPGCELGRLTQQ